MKAIPQLVAEIQAEFRLLIDGEYLAGIKRVVPTTDAILGVPVPKIRAYAKRFAVEHRELTLEEVCQLLDAFGEYRSREGLLFGTFLLVRFRRQFTEGLWVAIDRWVEMIDNWETCDQMATNLGAEVVVTHLHLVDDLVRWATAPNPWRRRFALAVTTGLNQRGRSHPLEALRVCEHLMMEREPIVRKAVGWALREASQRDRAAVIAFLHRWRGKAQQSILREGSQALSDEERQAILAPVTL